MRLSVTTKVTEKSLGKYLLNTHFKRFSKKNKENTNHTQIKHQVKTTSNILVHT